MTGGESARGHLLYVDHHRQQNTVVGDALVDAAISFQKADGIPDAVKLLQEMSFDCIIVELSSDSAQFIERARKVSPTIPIIIVAQANNPDFPSSLVGIDELYWIDDPTDTSSLLAAIQRAISTHQLTDELQWFDALQRIVKEVLSDIVTAEDRHDIERVISSRLVDAEVFTFGWLGQYDPQSGDLDLLGPAGGRMTSTDLETIGGVDTGDLLEESVAAREVITCQATTQFRSAGTTRGHRFEGTSGEQSYQSDQSIVLVPMNWMDSVYYVLVFMTPFVIDTAERDLLNAFGRAAGKLIWLTDTKGVSGAYGKDRLEGIVKLFAHEIRNPLSIALNQLDHLNGEVDPSAVDRVTAQLQQIDTILETLHTVVADNDVQITTYRDIGTIAAAAWEDIEHPEAELFITGSPRIRADQDLLERLFSNLFRNAVQYGGSEVLIRVGSLPDGFFVEDDGPGIPVADRERVFEWGFSGDEYEMGVGLSFVREIVHLHGWSISITSSDLGGTRFEIRGVGRDNNSGESGGGSRDIDTTASNTLDSKS